MDTICPKDVCCGCKVCVTICPKSAISMKKAANGFFYPEVSSERCVDCKLCVKTCPANNDIAELSIKQELYSAYSINYDVRKRGSSGGIFEELATAVLEQSGIVYGAAFDECLVLKHTSARSIHELRPLLKSKYVECDTDGVYESVLDEIRLNTPILFCGTPCQCAALRNFLRVKKIQSDKLYIVDFLCHGVPSQDLFTKCVKDYGKRKGGKIIEFNFRDKPKARRRHCCHYFSCRLFTDKGVREFRGLPAWDFPYYWGFVNYYSLRPSCYECKFACPNRLGDITLGDFWRLETIVPIRDFPKGYSMLLINTKKGGGLLNNVKDKLSLLQYPTAVAKSLNPTFTRGAIRTVKNQNSLKDLERLSFNEYRDKYMILKMDIFSRILRSVKCNLLSIYEKIKNK